MTRELRVIGLDGLPEIEAGDDLGALIVDAAGDSPGILPGDVVVVAQKAVSKAEGRVTPANDRLPIALDESARVLRRSGDMVVSETRHGFVCANAGVDSSNVERGKVALLPLDPDLSARRIRARIKTATGVEVGVIVSDTFGRAWRIGQTNVAIGLAGMAPFADYRGVVDGHGNELSATRICLADEIAAAAELTMGKTDGICAAIVRGAPVTSASANATDIVRPSSEDLFR